MPHITVKLPHNSHSIDIEPGVLDRIGERIRAVAPHGRCMLAMDSKIADVHGSIAHDRLCAAGYAVATATITADERLKTLATVEHLYDAMLHAGMDRTSPMIALGGGITGDIAGFAAATFMRGVPLVHVPTTLLSMVDASIGGKTGVNFPLPNGHDLGKNLIGAFWQPRAVIIDPHVLRTLEPRELRCGLAECIKHAMIAEAPLLGWLHEHARAIELLDPHALVELISCSTQIKAKIVSVDERETGTRARLNLGHTFAHALESVSELELRHGEAVAIGLRAASHVAVLTRRMTSHEQHLVLDTIARCGLPSRLHRSISVDRLMNAMAFDKKNAQGQIRLVLPQGIGSAELVPDIPASLIRETWMDLGASA